MPFDQLVCQEFGQWGLQSLAHVILPCFTAISCTATILKDGLEGCQILDINYEKPSELWRKLLTYEETYLNSDCVQESRSIKVWSPCQTPMESPGARDLTGLLRGLLSTTRQVPDLPSGGLLSPFQLAHLSLLYVRLPTGLPVTPPSPRCFESCLNGSVIWLCLCLAPPMLSVAIEAPRSRCCSIRGRLSSEMLIDLQLV